MPTSREQEKSRGVVLVIVLVLFMALSGLTLMTIEVSSRGAVEAARVRSEYEAHFKAEEALFMIYRVLRDDRTPFSDTAREEWADGLDYDGVHVSIAPCNAKIDLNKLIAGGNSDRILKIMSQIFPGGTNVKRLMGSLGVWVGLPVSKALSNIDSLYYASQFPPYSPRGKGLKTPEEVLLVNGWRDFSRQWVDETFTVWSSESKLNINFASKKALLAYFPKLGKKVAQIVHWRNTRGFTDLSQVINVVGIQSDSELYKDMLELLTVRSDVFEALVVAEASGCTVVKRYIISRPSTFETEQPTLVFQNDVSVTFAPAE
ncbi:type II secretion system protein GspK [Maridesulfovibrio sp.]|uniref:general secretion pathway protein GspK n=1 Tax=Maridesulfovibrio sp. TaxID=2795000 RepID=UPI002A18DCE4|nr:type II secretion system protein GspK [Maridesulfovibrio sp.]